MVMPTMSASRTGAPIQQLLYLQETIGTGTGALKARPCMEWASQTAQPACKMCDIDDDEVCGERCSHAA
jgi:hypothetical protein